jgi:Ca2+-binding EF-hand superfamily protein
LYIISLSSSHFISLSLSLSYIFLSLCQAVFQSFASNKKTIQAADLRSLLASLGNEPTKKELEEAQISLGAQEGITFDIFQKWYENSLFWTDTLKLNEERANKDEEEEQSLYQGMLGKFKNK